MTAAACAALVASPSLLLPFISDDWVHLWAADRGVFLQNPFLFFRPLTSVSYWIDWQLWGLKPAPFHLTNVVLSALAAMLVVIVVRQYTEDAALAGLTGVVFALHPYHVNTVTWIAARSDLLSAVFVLLALLRYERWRLTKLGFPFAALVFYELGMLSKEPAVVVPGVLVVLAMIMPSRRPSPQELLRGYVPLIGLGLVHFCVVRRFFVGGMSLGHLRWIRAWKGNLRSYGATSVLPPPPEIFEEQVWTWSMGSALVVGILLLAAWRRTGRVPPVVWPAAGAFVALLGPSLIGFNTNYYYLPSGASALALAALLRASGPRVGGAVGTLLLIGWTYSSVDAWKSEFVAARGSDRFIGALLRASREPGTRLLVVVGIPHRIRGVPVTTDYSRVVPFLGGAGVRIESAGEFDFPTDHADALRTHSSPTAAEMILGVTVQPTTRCETTRVGARLA